MSQLVLGESWKVSILARVNSDVSGKMAMKSPVKSMESNGVLRMARRIARFTREEAAYWYSRATNFGVDANRWALSGMRIMLGGQPADPAVGKHLRRLMAEGP